MKKKVDLVILAGGKGSRLKGLTRNTPKPLLKINKISFLQYLINYYSKYDFEKIYILAGYKGSKIKRQFHNKIFNLIPIECFIEKKKMDTAGALYILKNKINNNFVLINGDSFFDYDIKNIIKSSLNSKIGQMLLIKNFSYKSNSKLSKLGINNQSEVFFKKNHFLMNSGVYFFKKKFLNLIKNEPRSLETDILPKLISNRKISGVYASGYFIDIGTKKNLDIAKKEFKNRFLKPAIFLDRDGVINKDTGHVHKISQLIYRKNIFKALNKLNNFYIFVVTNQAGIAKGYYNEKDFIRFQKKIKEDFINKKIYFNDVKYCPHHPEGRIKKYKIKCKCRKPENGMFLEIMKNWPINIKKSLMIGDKPSDLYAVKKLNIPFQFVEDDIDSQLDKFKS